MRLQFIGLVLTLAAGALAAPYVPRAPANQTRDIQWTPCEITGQTMPVFCSTLSVPLDYLSPNNSETIDLNLYKVAAAKQPSKGTILLNFGGPGLPSGTDLAVGAEHFQRYTAGSFDLVTLDPRGTVPETLPFSCFGTPEELSAFNLANPGRAWNASSTAIYDDWAQTEIYTDACKNNSNVTSYGSYLGTTYTARDYMSVVDSLGEDGLLRYWGFSYGSILGSTLAAMFPDRIDRMIIDGVLNIHEYWHDADIEKYYGTDKSFSEFLKTCFDAGAEKCALASRNTTASAFEADFYAWLEDFRYHPFAGPGYKVDYTMVKSWILISLYTHTNFPNLAAFLDSVMKGEFPAELDTSPAAVSGGEPLFGIECADKVSRADGVDGVLPALEKQNDFSRVAGDTAATLVMTCAQWPMASTERYLGDFNVRTRHPLLMIGNTYDPVTPFASAKNASDAFPGSVALEHKGLGHSSVAQASICTMEYIQNYFLDGTLPEPGTVCEVDQPPFSNVTWRDVLPKPLS